MENVLEQESFPAHLPYVEWEPAQLSEHKAKYAADTKSLQGMQLLHTRTEADNIKKARTCAGAECQRKPLENMWNTMRGDQSCKKSLQPRVKKQKKSKKKRQENQRTCAASKMKKRTEVENAKQELEKKPRWRTSCKWVCNQEEDAESQVSASQPW